MSQGLGEDQYGSRMGRAVEILKRVADPTDRYTYRDARWRISQSHS